MQVATGPERRRLLLAFLDTLRTAYGPTQQPVGYRKLHDEVRSLQTRLRERHSLDLGYKFQDVRAWGVYDRGLELDIEILQAKYHALNDDLSLDVGGSISHENHPSARSEHLVGNARRYGWWTIRSIPLSELEPTMADLPRVGRDR